MLSSKSWKYALLSTLILSVSYPLAQVTIEPVTAHAIRPTQGGDYEDFNPKDPASWSQNLDGNPKHLVPEKKKGAKGVMFDGSGGYTKDACMIFSLTFVYLKAGVMGIGTTPSDVHDKVFDTMKPYGWMQYNQLTSKDMNGKLEVVESYYSGGSFAKAKKAWENGYLVILIVPIAGGSHAIAIDKIEGNEIYILDSGNWGLKLSDKYGNNSILGMTTFKLKDGRKARDLPVLQDHPDGSWADGAGAKKSKNYRLSDKQKAYNGGGGVWYPDEDKIPNMPTPREFLELQNAGQVKGADNYHDFVERLNVNNVKEDFKQGTSDKAQLEQWKEERSSNLSSKSVQGIRILIMVLAVVILMLTPAFVLVYWTDRWNVLGIPLMSLLTGGRVRVLNGEDYLEHKASSRKGERKFRAINDWSLFLWVAVFTGFAVFLLTGHFYKLLAWFSEVLGNLLGKF